MNLKHFIQELKRRNVFKVVGVYAVAGWVLIQIAATTFPFFGIPAWGVRFVVGLVLLGFPIAIILAWAFELTPEGMKRTEEVPAEKSVTKKTGRKLNIILGILLVMAVGIILYQDLYKPTAASTKEPESGNSFVKGSAVSQKSIAVLPFANDSGDSTQRYFSEGLSESLIIALSQYPALTVIGRESSFHLRNTSLDSKQIGKKLGVATLLEGSVSHENNEVRVRAELVSTTNGRTLWSNQYDRPYKNLFALQDDITKAVATALKAKLLRITKSGAVVQTDRPPSGSPKAYNAYLEGNFYMNQFNKESIRKAIHAYRQAIHIDSKYAAAYAGLSYAWTTLGTVFSSETSPTSLLAKARMTVDTALNLDPNLAVARVTHGYLLLVTHNYLPAEAALRRAYKLDPGNAVAKIWLAWALASLGRSKESIHIGWDAIAVNPLDARAYRHLAALLAGVGQFREAERVIEQAISLEPTAGALHALLAEIEVLQRNPKAALKAAQAEPSIIWRLWAKSLAYQSADEKTRANKALKELIAKYANIMAYQIVEIYAYRGESNRAFNWLDRAWRQGDPGVGFLLFDPFLRRYKSDPRFTAFCKKAGLPPPDSTDAVSLPPKREPKL